MNQIYSVLSEDEGITQARGCLRHKAGREFHRWHCNFIVLVSYVTFINA